MIVSGVVKRRVGGFTVVWPWQAQAAGHRFYETQQVVHPFLVVVLEQVIQLETESQDEQRGIRLERKGEQRVQTRTTHRNASSLHGAVYDDPI